MHANEQLTKLVRVNLADNKLSDYDSISGVFTFASATDVALEQNKIANDPSFRAIMVSKLRYLKFLNRRRILDEERRNAAKNAKKSAERVIKESLHLEEQYIYLISGKKEIFALNTSKMPGERMAW